MPRDVKEVLEVVAAIEAGVPNSWCSISEQPEKRVRAGDWRPCQFFDPELPRAAMRLEADPDLVPLKKRYSLGPAGQGIRAAFRPIPEDDDGYRVFWSRSQGLRFTMLALPEQRVAERKSGLAARYRRQAGHVLVAAKFRTDSGRLLALFSEEPALGSMWVPIRTPEGAEEEAKALCAWLNSTLGALQFLMRRSTTLTNPSFSQADLETIRIPDFRKVPAAPLAEAYERLRFSTVRPWREAAQNDLRDDLDRAARATVGIDLATIRDLRTRISKEPTVSNQTAPA